ncbi:hypothetical protein RhiirC2_408649 [Rhizophagus irregularis]|uniref:Uncharacterized protein n=1 Tax=Rhizophagus irregularis TaxID=588596 RepID=A0A2N1ND80_9GLOM|nr:hypothetical protein RhiirC2_408649 [Rhizophagus irregularis]
MILGIHLFQITMVWNKNAFLNNKVKELIEQARIYNDLTVDSIKDSRIMAAYASDFKEYVEILREEDVSGTDFIEAMKSQYQAAISNKNSSAKLTKSYCDILAIIKNVCNDLEEKESTNHMFAAIGTGVGTGLAIAAAPFTGGASLAVIGALGVSSAGAMIGTSITSVQFGDKAKATELELKRIEETKTHIRIAIAGLVTMVDKFSSFDEFFQKEAEDINKIIEKYEHDVQNITFRMSRMKSTAMKKQWSRIQQLFESYIDSVKPLLSERRNSNVGASNGEVIFEYK